VKRKLIGIGAVMLVLALLLTLAPSCGNGEEGATPTPEPGITPTPGVTPTPTADVKTLKIGMILPFSGPAAPWGIQTEQGANWARDRINLAGGIKVGGDTYMIEFVKCDDKYIGSEGITCATRMVFEEQVHWVLGSIGVNVAINPILTDGKVISMGIGNANAAQVTPEHPYRIYSLQDFINWTKAFYRQVAKAHPEVKTVAVMGLEPSQGSDSTAEIKDAVETQMDVEVVHASAHTAGVTDFYPFLTPIIAKNPDMIALYSQGVGAQALIIKQARELGYEGILAASNHGEPLPGCAIAGNEAYTGVYHNEPVYDSDLYPEATRELYAEFTRIYPGEPCGLCHYLGFSTIYFYKQLIEQTGSIDPDDALTLLDDPTWTYEWWGQPGRSLGGLETFGIRRVNQDETVLTSTDANCQKVPVSRELVIVP